MRFTGIEHNTLGSCSFTSVNVGNDPNISVLLERILTSHSSVLPLFIPKLLRQKLNTIVREGAVRLCHLMGLVTLADRRTSFIEGVNQFASQFIGEGFASAIT